MNKLILAFMLFSGTASAQSFASDNRVINALFADESYFTEITYNKVKIVTYNDSICSEIRTKWHFQPKERIRKGHKCYEFIVPNTAFYQIREFLNPKP